MATTLPMTAGRRVALAVGAPLALIFIGFTGLSLVAAFGQGSYRVNLSLPTQGYPVSVTVESGDVTVGPAAGGRVLVHGIARYALARSQVTWRRSSSAGSAGLTVRSRCHQITGNCSFELAVGLPIGSPATISADDGNIAVRDLAEPLTLHSLSGDVNLADLTGTVGVTGHSGNVVGQRLSGSRITISQDAGDITVNGLASRDVTAVDHSGNVTLTFSKVPAHVTVTSFAGDVDLVLPPGPTAYHVAATTKAGTATIEVPVSSFSQHEITVTDNSGNVTVTH